MAIGDTVQAGLMRVDSSPILLAGQAQAKANQAFGDALGGAVEKFYQKKKDKQEREQRERAYRDAGLSAEEAKAASGDKELGSLLINKMNADRNFSLEQQNFFLELQKNKRAADLLDLEKNQILRKNEKTKSDDLARDNFLKKLFTPVPTGKLNEAGQDELERGSLFLAPGPEAQEKFRNELLQNPSLQQTEPVFNMTGNRFMAQFANESPVVQNLALTFSKEAEKRRAESVATGLEEFKDLRKAEGDLRKEFNALPVVKDFDDVRTAFLKVKSAAENPSAAGDLALVFNYMKILDPGSVVREGEFQTAADATSWLQRSEDDGIAIPLPIAKAIRKLEDGTLLTGTQREDFLNTARNTASAQFKPAKEALSRYKGLAANSGLREDQIIPSNYLEIEEELSDRSTQSTDNSGIKTSTQGNYKIGDLSVGNYQPGQ